MRIYNSQTGRLDVDLMIALAKTDPDALEAERKEVLAYAVGRARPELQQQLEQLCFQRLGELRHFKNPVSKMDRGWELFLQDLCIFVHGLEGRDVRDAYKEKNTQPAIVLPFSRKT